MSLLDTTGGDLMDAGLPGTRHGDAPWAIKTAVNAGTTGTVNAAGGIDGKGTVDFGVAVADGTVEGTIVPFSATNGSQTIRGITSRLAQMSATLPDNLVGYPTNAELGIYTLGEINAIAAEDVRQDDAVLALSTPVAWAHGTANLGGTKGGIANGTTRILMTGYRWRGAVSAGQVGVIDIIGQQPTATLTS
jgi:hypothetical protein